MGLLDHLETQLERQIPAQLQAALQQALDDYQPLCDRCRLAMHRHHRYARATAISLAVQGLSYAHAGNWVGCVKSTACQ